jgi:hypothetical protein
MCYDPDRHPSAIGNKCSEAVNHRCFRLSSPWHCEVSSIIMLNLEQSVTLTTDSWCMVGTDEYQIVGPTRTQDFQAQYTDCHTHSTQTWVYTTYSITVAYCLLGIVLTVLGRMLKSSPMLLLEVKRPHTQTSIQTNIQMSMRLRSQLVLASIAMTTQVSREYSLPSSFGRNMLSVSPVTVLAEVPRRRAAMLQTVTTISHCGLACSLSSWSPVLRESSFLCSLHGSTSSRRTTLSLSSSNSSARAL